MVFVLSARIVREMQQRKHAGWRGNKREESPYLGVWCVVVGDCYIPGACK
jgi:hypothetical protein